MKIGVFDSGIGGKAIADTLENDYPAAEVIYVNDHKNVPYGNRSQAEIIELTDSAIQPLIDEACDVIVLACNTATAAAIETLRDKYPSTPFIGLEPMVKSAAEQTKTGIVAICATPFTLKSSRYTKLKNEYARNITVLEPDCSDWAYQIEHSRTDDLKIADLINEVCDSGADVIVLACTHYHWIKEDIIKISNGRAIVIDPSEAISRRVKEALML
ncbi:MAG: glutamate racemase [Candidatus Saccharimonadaceae bacterium]